MLKAISVITNPLGALNYKGTWNASTNTPTLTSSVGAKGDYYVVSVAGSTNLNGETLWGVGDWAVFNGSVWQRVEGGNTINATTVSASTSVSTPVIQALSSAGGTLKNDGGTNQMQWGLGGGSNLSLEVATNINPANAAVNISPTGSGTVTINPATASTMNNVAIGGTTALAGRFTTITATTGNVVIGTSGQGIDFSATPGTGTSELLADYEEGTWTPVDQSGAGLTFTGVDAYYTKIGNQVTAWATVTWPSTADVSHASIGGLPFTSKNAAGIRCGSMVGLNTSSTFVSLLTQQANSFSFLFGTAGVVVTNVNMSGATLGYAVTYQV
jgi:hypothetical protein